MGAIRSFLLVFTVVLLFLSVFATIFSYTLSLSLRYDNLQASSANVIKHSLQGFNLTYVIGKQYNLIQLYCKNNSDFYFTSQGYNFDIPCSVANQGESAIIEAGTKSLINDVYYTQYDCNFIDCFTKSSLPLFLVSEKTYNFFTEKLYLLLVISFALLSIIFFLVEKKTNLLILAGSMLIISSIPFFKIDILLSFLSNKIIFEFLKIFFSQAYFVSIRTLIAGIVLLAAGIALDILKIGFKIPSFISKIKQKKKEKEDEEEIVIVKKSAGKKNRKSK